MRKTIQYFALMVFMISSYSFAEQVREEKKFEFAAPADKDGFSNEADTWIRYMPASGVEAMGGKISLIEAGFKYSREFKVMGELPVDIMASYDYIKIDKSVPVPLPASLSDLELSIDTKFPFFNIKDIYFGAGITPSFMFDGDSFGGESFLIPARGYLIYILGDSLILAGGAQFFSDFDNNVAPIGGVIYKPNNRLTFNLITDDPYISYKAMDKLEVVLQGGYSLFDQYKTRKDGSENTILEYRDIRLGGGVSYMPTKNIKASFNIGGVFYRQLSYPDAGGKVDINKGMYLEGNINAQF